MAKVRNIPEFIKAFTEGKVKNLEQFRTYQVYEYGDLFVLQYKNPNGINRYTGKKVTTEEVLAYRFPDGSCICNANQIRSAGHGTIYGTTDREGENTLQKLLQTYGAVPIPFTLFTESKLDVRDFAWVCKPVPETVTVKITEQVYNRETQLYEDVVKNIDRHFVGAAVFKIENEVFFFDIDRQELDHGIFNAFITKLPAVARTVKEAYDLLMPDEVKTAVENGVDIKRQGEFFFVKVSDECPSEATPLTKEDKTVLKCKPSRFGYMEPGEIDRNTITYEHLKFPESELTTPDRIAFNKALDKYQEVVSKITARFPKQGTLGKSSSSSHHVGRYIEFEGSVYASGRVEQSRRQHADLMLNGWYKVIPNTGVFSWTITGRVD
jgi:hypothetical protein